MCQKIGIWMSKSSTVVARVSDLRDWRTMSSSKCLTIHQGLTIVELVISFALDSEHACGTIVIADHFNVAYEWNRPIFKTAKGIFDIICKKTKIVISRLNLGPRG